MTRIPDPDRSWTELELAEWLGISVRLLRRYERVGLIHASRREAGVVIYSAEQARRAWTIVSLHRDLGVNLAGIEIILAMNERIRMLQAELARLLAERSQKEASPQR